MLAMMIGLMILRSTKERIKTARFAQIFRGIAPHQDFVNQTETKRNIPKSSLNTQFTQQIIYKTPFSSAHFSKSHRDTFTVELT